MSKRTSEWFSTDVSILGCFGPQWSEMEAASRMPLALSHVAFFSRHCCWCQWLKKATWCHHITLWLPSVHTFACSSIAFKTLAVVAFLVSLFGRYFCFLRCILFILFSGAFETFPSLPYSSMALLGSCSPQCIRLVVLQVPSNYCHCCHVAFCSAIIWSLFCWVFSSIPPCSDLICTILVILTLLLPPHLFIFNLQLKFSFFTA